MLQRHREGLRRGRASRCRTSRRCCTAPPSPPTRSWRARAPRVGLVTTKGFRQVLQIARSYVPGGLAGWIIWPKPEPLAALENTVEVDERIASDGTVIRELDEADVRAQLGEADRDRRARRLPDQLVRRPGARAPHRRDRGRGAARRAGVAVLRRAAGAARVRAHGHHGRERLRPAAGQALRRDAGRRAARERRGGRAGHPAQRRRAVGGRAPRSARRSRCCSPARRAASRARCGSPSSAATPTSSRSTWAARPPTSRWCRASARGSGARPRSATSPCARPVVDVRTVGAGGGSIAHVPQLTKALRVGPQSAGADPGPAAYGKGGAEPTVTDANVVLGYLPAVAGRRRDHARRRRRAGRGADRRRRDGPGVGRGRGGGHRRHRQREHARRPAPGVGAAGLRPARLRARRVRRRGPVARQRARQADGRLAGDRAAVAGRAVRARRRDDVRPQRVGPHRAAPLRRPDRRRPARASSTSWPPRPAARLAEQGVPDDRADHRVPGGRPLPRAGLRDPGRRSTATATSSSSRPAFDAEHERLFSFLLTVDHELVNARATVTGPAAVGRARHPGRPATGHPKPSDTHPIYVDGGAVDAASLRPGHAAGRRRDHRSRDRHRDGLDHPRAARPRGHRARVRLPAHQPVRRR